MSSKRGGGRAGKASQKRAAIEQRPFKQPRLIYEPTKIVSDDELEFIHQASLRVLREQGMVVMNDEARGILKDAGAEVDEDTNLVRIDEHLVDSAIASAPEQFTMHARNPANNVTMGGSWFAFGPVSSPPNAGDMVGGRRTGNLEDYQNLLRLNQYFNCIHLNGGYPVEPVDVHASTRHLVALKDMATLTDKCMHIYSLGAERNHDGLEIVRLSRGISQEQFEREPSCMTVINTNSPLKLDIPMAQGILEMARAGQVTCVTPFTLAGAMAPVTIAGAVTQQNAEALMGLTLCQLVRKGAPFIYGAFTSNVDMKSGAPAFGTPEYMKAAMISGQLCRRYGVPYRTSGVCAANTVDAQAAYETVFSMWGAIMGGGNLIKHAAGWLEGGLRASFEKYIVDVDLLQMISTFLEPLDTSEDALGLEAMADVGPGGHFFGTAHTQSRYTDAFYQPLVSDWRNFETWEEAGQPDAMQKAHGLYKQVLVDYQEPKMEVAQREALDAFVERRISEGGVKTDF